MRVRCFCGNGTFEFKFRKTPHAPTTHKPATLVGRWGSRNDKSYCCFFNHNKTTSTITATLTARAITPQADSTYDLGTNSVRWANVYADDVRTGDLHLSNEHRGGNSIDGSWGHYTIMEGEDDLFITNKRSGKKFRFVLEQI